jgi:putative restriction endonuclease
LIKPGYPPTVRIFVGVTDGAWYRFLAARPDLTEANFWLPSGIGFRSLSIGEPFAFKSHSPHNRIVGGGFFNGWVKMPVSDAWRIFGLANGVGSLAEMRAAIGRYRRQPLGTYDDPEIGCVMLRDTVFLDEAETLPVPTDWSANIVRGKSYDAAGPQAGSIVEALFAASVARYVEAHPTTVPGPVFGPDRLVASRLGQRPFQALVLDAYHRRCAVTGEKIRPVLQAAHIVPVSKGGENRLDNGLLLRSDVHTLFDAGYLSVDPKLRLMVSPRLRVEFENGVEFYERAGEVIGIPDRRADRPNPEYLEWHADTVFMRS